MSGISVIKDIFEIIRGGASLEFGSKEGTKNQIIVGLLVALSCVYIYCQSQTAIAYAQYLHKQTSILPFYECIEAFVLIFLLCYLLMCLTFAWNNKIRKFNPDKPEIKQRKHK